MNQKSSEPTALSSEPGALSVGRVAKRIGVEAHTIRFWTSEFKDYIPYNVGKGGRRYYSTDVLPVFERIKCLIHSDGIRIRVIQEKRLLAPKPSEPSALNDELCAVKNVLLSAKRALEELP